MSASQTALARTLSTTPLPTPADGNAGYVSPAEAKSLLDDCASLDGEIQSYFRIPKGDTYRTYFPNMGVSPELDGVDGLFVVVYSGPVTNMMYTGIPGASPENVLQDVLCIVLPTGEPIVYHNVSREGMTLPPGAFR